MHIIATWTYYLSKISICFLNLMLILLYSRKSTSETSLPKGQRNSKAAPTPGTPWPQSPLTAGYIYSSSFTASKATVSTCVSYVTICLYYTPRPYFYVPVAMKITLREISVRWGCDWRRKWLILYLSGVLGLLWGGFRLLDIQWEVWWLGLLCLIWKSFRVVCMLISLCLRHIWGICTTHPKLLTPGFGSWKSGGSRYAFNNSQWQTLKTLKTIFYTNFLWLKAWNGSIALLW